MRSHVQWRRKPEPRRRPRREEHTITIECHLVDAPRRNGLRLTAVADDDSPWRGVKARITVEEAVTMNANETRSWLSVEGNAVLTRENGIWSSYEYSDGKACVEDEYGPFRPLLPATRTQVEMAAEIERLTKRVNELVDCHEQDRKLIAEARTRLLDATTERNDARAARDSAIDSQKAAVAALEQERKINASIKAALRNLGTAGKGSG